MATLLPTTSYQPKPQPVSQVSEEFCRQLLTPEQRRHRHQMDQRTLHLEKKMSTLAAYTVLPGRNRADFSGSLDAIDKAVDVVLTKTWKSLPGNRIRAGSRFCAYKAHWDADTGEISIGGAELNPFAKDLSCRPFVGARGKVFDYSANLVNWLTGMALDAQMEAAARQPSLQLGAPMLSEFLLGFNPDEPPQYAVTPTLKADLIEAILSSTPGDPGPLLSAGVDGIVIDLDDFPSDDVDGLRNATRTAIIRQGNGREEEVELPAFCEFTVSPGESVKSTDPIAIFGNTNFTTIADLERMSSPHAVDILLRRQWGSKYTIQKAWAGGEQQTIYCIPYAYVSLDCSKRSRVQLRDVAQQLGRVTYQREHPGEMATSSPNEAAIQVWDTHGDPDRLIGTYRGVRYNFRDVRAGWAHYFESLPAPE